MKTSRLSLAAAGLLLCLGASAQSMKPGLWEITNKMGGNPEMEAAQARAQQQMANMPPEQRKMMEEMMAKNGVRMGAGAGGAMVVKTCISKEMAERHQMPVQQQGNCTTTISDKTASGMKMKYICTDPASTGEGTFSFQGDTGYTMKMQMNTTRQGKAMHSTMDATGKWLGADCGNLKPIQMPSK